VRVYISVDIEGVAGVVHPDQAWSGRPDYPIARRHMTQEANAAVAGAFEAGASAVLVNDSHGGMKNLLLEDLDPRVQIIVGNLKPYSMVQGLEERYDLALFVGYHAGMGATGGILDHTYSGACVSQVQVNGQTMNETGVNALLAGVAGTPVGLVTGDAATCAEARELLPGVETVTVKWGISRYCARTLHPVEAQRLIREAARGAVRRAGEFKPFRLNAPYTLRLKFLNSGMADGASLMPGVNRVDGLTIEYASSDMRELYRGMRAAIALAGTTIP
jgi:D-amino peptidase